MSATSTLNIVNNYRNSSVSGTGGTDVDTYNDNPNYPFAAGTAANQIDSTWSATGTLATTSVTYTVSALPGPRGSTVAMARVRKIWVHSLAVNETGTNTLKVTAGATHPWSPPFDSTGIVIPPGGCLLLMAPLTTGIVVSAGASDQFTLTSVGSVSYSVSLEGSSV